MREKYLKKTHTHQIECNLAWSLIVNARNIFMIKKVAS